MTPSANAAASAGELSRMSWPTTTARVVGSSAAQQPGQRRTEIAHDGRVELSPTTPRMS